MGVAWPKGGHDGHFGLGGGPPGFLIILGALGEGASYFDEKWVCRTGGPSPRFCTRPPPIEVGRRPLGRGGFRKGQWGGGSGGSVGGGVCFADLWGFLRQFGMGGGWAGPCHRCRPCVGAGIIVVQSGCSTWCTGKGGFLETGVLVGRGGGGRWAQGWLDKRGLGRGETVPARVDRAACVWGLVSVQGRSGGALGERQGGGHSCPPGGSGQWAIRRPREGRDNGPYADSFPLRCRFHDGGGAGFGGGGGGRGPARGGGGAPDPYISGVKWPPHHTDHFEVQM